VLKLSSNGNYQWHTFYGTYKGESECYENGMGIAVEASGDVYVVGSALGWDGPDGQEPLNPYQTTTAFRLCDIIVLKLSSSGAYLWHTYFGGFGDDKTSSVAITLGGMVFLAGNSDVTV
jgi:hypothetical protein